MATVIESIQIENLAKEEPFYIQLKLAFSSGQIEHIKFLLDQFTYENLKKLVLPRFLNNSTNKMTCFIPVNPPKMRDYATEIEWIIWDVFGQQNRFSCSCSPEYKTFLNELRRIRSFEDLYDIVVEKAGSKNGFLSLLAQNKTRYLFRLMPVTLWLLIFILGPAPTALLGEQKLPISKSEAEIFMEGVTNHDPATGLSTIPAPVSRYNVRPDNIEIPEIERIIVSLPKGQVALTFDDGPSVYTQDILSILNEHDVRATFFFIGNKIALYPQVISDVRDQKHIIGVHSFSHQVLRNLPFEDQEEDIANCLEAIKPYCNNVSLFRPPYGMYDANTEKALLAHQMSLVLWNRDPRDWNARSPQQVVDMVLDTSPSGGIYLLHENAMTLKALPHIINAIQEMGLDFVVLGNYR